MVMSVPASETWGEWGGEETEYNPKRNKHTKTPTVLLVEDDLDQQAIFNYFLRAEGFSVLVAKNAEDAYRIIHQKNIDCLVSDVMMPGIGGAELVSNLRKTRRGEFLPVIMFTSSSQDLEAELLLRGADMFCQKRDARRMLASQIRYLLHK